MGRSKKEIFRSLIICFLIIMVFNLVACAEGLEPTKTLQNAAVKTKITPTQTPEVTELFSYQADLTNNIVLMGIIIVLIVIGGTLSVIWRKQNMK